MTTTETRVAEAVNDTGDVIADLLVDLVAEQRRTTAALQRIGDVLEKILAVGL